MAVKSAFMIYTSWINLGDIANSKEQIVISKRFYGSVEETIGTDIWFVC